MKKYFVLPTLLFSLSLNALSQSPELEFLPSYSFKFKKVELVTMNQETTEVLDTRDIVAKGHFKVHPKNKTITYKGGSFLPINKNARKYSIQSFYEDPVTITFITKSDDLRFETLIVFWKDNQMMMIIHPDEGYAFSRKELE